MCDKAHIVTKPNNIEEGVEAVPSNIHGSIQTLAAQLDMSNITVHIVIECTGHEKVHTHCSHVVISCST